MNFIATAVVHTTGINWESVGTLVATIVGSFAAAALYISNRMEKSRQATEALIISKAKELIDSVTNNHLDVYRHTRRKGR